METPGAAYKHQRAIEDRSYLIKESWFSLLRNVFLTVLIGIVVWLFASSLVWMVEKCNDWIFDFFTASAPHLKNSAPWILLGILILGGVIRDAILRFHAWQDAEGDGVASSTKHFYEAYQQQLKGIKNPNAFRYKKPDFMAAIRRLILTILTIGTGGSGGLEGPVIPIGEAIASGWSRIFKIISPDDLRIFQMAGISAAFSTLLNAPYMSALFAAEVIFSDHIIYRPLFFSLIAAIVAYILNNHFLHITPLFTFHLHTRFYSPAEYFYVTLVAILISAPAGFGLKVLFKKLKQLIQIVPKHMQATVGAIITGGIALSVWAIWGIAPEHVLGVGEKTLRAVYEGTSNTQLNVWWILIIIVLTKALTTGFTLMAGGSAGLLIPAMFMGGISGAAFYYILLALGIPLSISSPEIFIVSGVASSLVAVINVPLAAIAFVLEGFGAAFGPPAIAACVVCHLLAKRLGLYEI